MTAPQAGQVGRIERRVTRELTADRFGNPGVAVLATPALIALFEEAAIACISESLEPGQGTVGTRLDVRHLAATPVGFTVRAGATLREIDGRRLIFDVVAYDDNEQIGTGVHERSVVRMERFLEGARAKAAARSLAVAAAEELTGA